MVETSERGFLARLKATIQPLTMKEAPIVLLVFAITFVAIFALKMTLIQEMRGDAAMYLQGVQNLATRGALVSQTQASIVDYQNANAYLHTPAAEIAKNSGALFGTATPAAERSLLLGHAYWVLYPVALLSRVMPAQPLLFALFALSFSGLLLVAYYAMRRLGVTAAGASLFCLFLALQPAWSIGARSGQFYPDRLFLLTSIVLMCLALRPISPQRALADRAWLLVAAIACASINERGAIVAGVFLILYVALYFKKPGLDAAFKLSLGTALLVYGLFILRLVAPENGSYVTFLPTTPSALARAIQLPSFAPLIELFFLVNIPLLIFSFFEWRAAVIAFILMLPNIFGNVGGAEKVGWATHYPTFYFVPLVWAGMVGYTRFFQRASARQKVWLPYAALAALGAYLMILSPTTYNPPSIALSNIIDSPLPTLASALHDDVIDQRLRRAVADAATGIQNAVPPRSIVSSVEAGMPLLYHDRTIEYFPKDIDHADYAVLFVSQADGKLSYDGAISYLGPDEHKKLMNLVLARMKADGYDLAHPMMFPAYTGLAVVRRLHQSPRSEPGSLPSSS